MGETKTRASGSKRDPQTQQQTTTDSSSRKSSKKHQEQSEQSATGKSAMDPIVHKIDCTLEELFTGTTKKFKVKDKILNGPERIPIQKTFDVEIKPGFGEGKQIKFPATADFGKAVVFEVNTLPHKYFTRQGDDLVWKCLLTKKQLEKGVKIKIPLLDGSELKINSKDYPSIKQGARLPFQGHGMPKSSGKGSKQRGDLIVHFEVSS